MQHIITYKNSGSEPVSSMLTLEYRIGYASILTHFSIDLNISILSRKRSLRNLQAVDRSEKN